jgi:hypothetical protein
MLFLIRTLLNHNLGNMSSLALLRQIVTKPTGSCYLWRHGDVHQYHIIPRMLIDFILELFHKRLFLSQRLCNEISQQLQLLLNLRRLAIFASELE